MATAEECSNADNPPYYSFINDYSDGGHPTVVQALSQDIASTQPCYGKDKFCDEAKTLIKQKLGVNDASIFFVAGGTSANLVLLASLLRPYETIIAPTSGHIVIYEAGAIEATGHKIITTPTADGKLRPADIELVHRQNANFPHMAKPKLVYITNTSELGTIYTKADLLALSTVCRKLDLILYLDGARLAAALTSPANDLTLHDIYELTDVFWIGGTKVGALFGEAIVIKDPVLAAEFPFHMKQRGALLAKGRVLGLQFAALFRHDLFFDLGRKANVVAQSLSIELVKMGYILRVRTETNQVFAFIPRVLVKELKTCFGFIVWEDLGGDDVLVRFVTSWTTQMSDVEALISYIKRLKETMS